jgi:hypothetical protein
MDSAIGTRSRRLQQFRRQQGNIKQDKTSLRASFLQGGGDVIVCHMHAATAVLDGGQF